LRHKRLPCWTSPSQLKGKYERKAASRSSGGKTNFGNKPKDNKCSESFNIMNSIIDPIQMETDLEEIEFRDVFRWIVDAVIVLVQMIRFCELIDNNLLDFIFSQIIISK
jgi:hypothetical protein